MDRWKILLSTALVASAMPHPYGHHAAQHTARVEAVEKEKRAPPVIYLEDSDEEEIGKLAESPPTRGNLRKREASSLDDGEIEESKRRKKNEGKESVSAAASDEVAAVA